MTNEAAYELWLKLQALAAPESGASDSERLTAQAHADRIASRYKMRPDIVWIRRDGTGVKLTEMENGHLANAIAFMRRHIAWAHNSRPGMLQHLLNEAKRRGWRDAPIALPGEAR